MDPHPLSRKILYLILCAISVLLLLNFLFLTNVLNRIELISLLGRLLSLDQQIEHPTIILAIIQGELILGFIAFFYLWKKGKEHAVSLLSKISFLICLLIILLSFLLYKFSFLPWRWYQEDGLFENISAILHFGSSFLFLLLIISKRKKNPPILISFIFFALFFFLGMEEISWGQRILNIKTPELVKEINTRNEINIHNILPVQYRDIVYYCIYSLFGLFLILINFIQTKIKKIEYDKKDFLFFPPPDFFYFGLLIFAMLLVRHYFVFWEVFEQILAVIGITYSIHIYSRFKKFD